MSPTSAVQVATADQISQPSNLTLVDFSKKPLQVLEIPALAQKYPQLQIARIDASLFIDADVAKLVEFRLLKLLVLENAKQLTPKALKPLYNMKLIGFSVAGAPNLGYYKLPSKL